VEFRCECRKTVGKSRSPPRRLSGRKGRTSPVQTACPFQRFEVGEQTSTLNPRLLGGGPRGRNYVWIAGFGARDPLVVVSAERAAASRTQVIGGGIRRCCVGAVRLALILNPGTRRACRSEGPTP
jgi:hypothetical protein